MAISRSSALAMSAQQRQFLISHIDGAVPLIRSAPHIHRTRTTLVERGLLHYDRLNNPTLTAITQEGRLALAIILGDAADALVQAGILDMELAFRVESALEARKLPAAAPALALSVPAAK